MPVTKTIEQRDNILRIMFKNELGQYHRPRGRPAIIMYNSRINNWYYYYYVNGVKYRPRKKGRDQPTYVAICVLFNIYVYDNEAAMLNQGVDRPYYVSLNTNGTYEIKYLNIIIMGGNNFKYIYNGNWRHIISYGINHLELGLYINRGERHSRFVMPPEYIRSCIPQNIPRATIMDTPLSYFLSS